MSLRTSSIFATDGSDATVEASKIQSGLQPQVGDTLSDLTRTNAEARRAQLRRRRAVVCESNGKAVGPGDKKLRFASLFDCPAENAICQRELFLQQGFIVGTFLPTTAIIDAGRGTNLQSI